MDEQADIDGMEIAAARRRRRRLRIGGGVAAMAAVLLGGGWLARKPIATHFIAQTLREKGVPASYEITRIGPRTQRLERLVLGDPANPDLRADWVEVDLGYGLFGVRVTGVRTGTVDLRAGYRDGRLSLGSLDRLMGEGTGATELPDIVAQLRAVRVALDTDAGPVRLALNGTGNLRSGFIGDLVAAAPRLEVAGCALDALDARTGVTTAGGEARLKGPVTVRSLDCADAGLSLAAPRIDADLRADPALARINGALALAAASLRQADRSAQRLTGLVTLRGSSDELEGSASLAATEVSLGMATTGALKIGGNYAVRPSAREQAYSYAGTVTAEEIRPAAQDEIARIETAAAGTPLDPLARKLAGALRHAARANRLTVSGRVSGEGQAMRLLVNGGQFSAASGARVALSDGGRATFDLPSGAWALDGTLETGGGGLPEAALAMASAPDGGLSGRLDLVDYRAGSARLGLTPVRFLRTARGAMRVNTTVSLDGPIGDGGVRGLVVPVDLAVSADGAMRLPRDCAPVRWASLRIGTAAFDPARFDLCGLRDGAAHISALALRGRIGESPLRLGVADARYALASGRFDLAGIEARIGAEESPVLLKAETLDGALGEGGALAGSFAQGSALIGTVPFDLSRVAGQWQFKDAALSLDGTLRIADRQADARFFPLDMERAHLSLADGRIAASGALVQPERKAPVATVTLSHDLGAGEGQADFALDRLRFGRALQPDDLTNMSQGIVQLVDGTVEGAGTVKWSSQGVTESTGTFSTRDMSFAAAFGPVTGFATTIEFTDLMALRTAPHQRLTARQVSAGVDVFDGVIDYALLSNELAVIEGGRWPFSGGTLELLPAMMNLDARQPRRFVFRVTGVDAGAFIQTLELENVSATGTFDGLFPMIFDEHGGRIEGGLLVARQTGLAPLIFTGTAADAIPECDTGRQAGRLSYVGPVSDADLGVMGKFAFDVLKNVRYRCLAVQLDGALDGEFVTQLRVNGINVGSEDARKSFLTRPFLGLPFIFNIRIEAPFRGLLGTAASIGDPTSLIRNQRNSQPAGANETGLAVQPADSDKGIEGKRE